MNRPMATDLRAWLRTHSGLITHGEAVRLGLTEAQIRRLVGTAAWARVQPGVYQDPAAGPPSPRPRPASRGPAGSAERPGTPRGTGGRRPSALAPPAGPGGPGRPERRQ